MSPDSADGSLLIHQDVRVYAGLFTGPETADFHAGAGRRMYVHVARGTLTVNDVALAAGDALQITRDADLRIEQGNDAEVLVFDLPGAG